MKKVCIEWVDAYTRDGWDEKQSAINITKPVMKCKTVGYLLDESKTHISICHTFNPQMVMGSLHIPKGCIIKRKVIKE